MNSRSAASAPARSARARPSPVETGGFVVAAKTWPNPPVASTTALACTAPTPSCCPSPRTCRVIPAARPSAVRSRSSASACSITRSPPPAVACVSAASRAREISAPVASPPACAIRRRRCPPSLVRASGPAGSRSNSAPVAISRRTASGPSVTSARTAAVSQTPAPAVSVSARCCSGESPGPSAAAMPPCAHRVEPSSSTDLVTSRMRASGRLRRIDSTAVTPATPEPTTTTSASSRQPGSGASSLPAITPHHLRRRRSACRGRARDPAARQRSHAHCRSAWSGRPWPRSAGRPARCNQIRPR